MQNLSSLVANTPGRSGGRTPFRSKTPKKTPGSDRYIAVRSFDPVEQMLACQNQSKVTNKNGQALTDGSGVPQERYDHHIEDTLSGATPSASQKQSGSSSSRILSFRQKAPAPPVHHQNNLRVLYTQNRHTMASASTSQVRKHRFISTTAERVLDAPDLLDDYYVNLLQWSANDTLAVGLRQSLYLWDAKSGGIDLLMETTDPEDYLASISWMSSGTHLAIGTTSNQVQLWDVEHKKKLRVMKGHQGRVCSLAWNKHILSSGSRSAEIHNHDVRVRDDKVSTFMGHSLEVCGLRWSPDGIQLASGGNDNLCNVWEMNQTSRDPVHSFTDHTAAVKALAWSPHSRHTLASGGGTSDRHIRFWNTSTGACLNSIDTNSQVCGLVWNPHEPEILSAHGFSKYQLTLWKYPSLGKIVDLTGHTARVLHLTLSSDGTTVCSGAADETLRFWKVFEPIKSNMKLAKKNVDRTKLTKSLNALNIR